MNQQKVSTWKRALLASGAGLTVTFAGVWLNIEFVAVQWLEDFERLGLGVGWPRWFFWDSLRYPEHLEWSGLISDSVLLVVLVAGVTSYTWRLVGTFRTFRFTVQGLFVTVATSATWAWIIGQVETHWSDWPNWICLTIVFASVPPTWLELLQLLKDIIRRVTHRKPRVTK